MATFDWKREFGRHNHRVVLSGQPIAIHCHHYNINLQKTIEDTLGQKGIRLIYRSAEGATYRSLNALLRQYGHMRTVKSKLEMAAILFQSCGLGIIYPQQVRSSGGYVISPSSHHVTGWLAKHGRRKTPGCHFSRGWIAGALAAIYSKPLGYYDVWELKCKMMRNPECVFKVEGH